MNTTSSMIANCPLVQSAKIAKINENTAAFSVGFFAERTSDGTPTQYLIDSLEEHELPVVGTFIHNYILPGFRYRVRLTGTAEYLFDGKALQLESVGQGYGKRLTFESKDILENDNYFWSDSNDTGFAFSIQVLFPAGEEYEVHDSHDRCIGSFSLQTVSEKQKVTGVVIEEGLVNVHVNVDLCGKLMLFPHNSLPNPLCGKEIPLIGSGIAIANRLSSTIKLLETDRSQSKILNLLDIKLFTKKLN